jgi:hypothetical protein
MNMTLSLCYLVAEAVVAYEQVIANNPTDTRARLLRGGHPLPSLLSMTKLLWPS